MVRRLAMAVVASVVATSCNCGDPRMISTAGGTLRVTLLSARSDASALAISMRLSMDEVRKLDQPIVELPLIAELEGIKPGTYTAVVTANDSGGGSLQSIAVSDVEIVARLVTEITLDLSTGAVIRQCNDVPICAQCVDGTVMARADDDRCGSLSCAALDTFEVVGANTATGLPRCVKHAHDPLTANRCAGAGACRPPNGPECTASRDVTLLEAGVCHTLSGCESGAPVLVTAPDGTPCGAAVTCQSGQCVGADAGVVDSGVPDSGVPDAGTNVGCSDGTREGFQSLSSYPTIAGCSGGWTVAGVTRADLVATCGRASGNAGTNREGTGCSAADLCQAGWHVCNGRDEVSAKANGSCADAVPAGAPDKSLFFAVNQPSQTNTTCDSVGDNDVFGCGNLGTQLVVAKGCGVLTRALASTAAGSCGFNEAEPTLGPWQCLGGTTSHLHEGALVTKAGCGGTSCSYGGQPIGNADKGGVLCCRD